MSKFKNDRQRKAVMSQYNKNHLSDIAKECVRKTGETNRYDTGNCVDISRCVVTELEKKGLEYPDDIYVIEPVFKEGGKTTFGYHQAVILPKKRLIVDTQLWQLSGIKPTNLKTRKVVFSYDEYKNKNLSW